MRTLLIDNHDSFTYNLFQLLAEVNGEEPLVVRNDELTSEEIAARDFDNVVLSPGPGRPERAADGGGVGAAGERRADGGRGRFGAGAVRSRKLASSREPLPTDLRPIAWTGDQAAAVLGADRLGVELDPLSW